MDTPKIVRRIWNLLHIRSRSLIFRATPRWFVEHLRYALRRALTTDVALPLWVTTKSGTRLYLSTDPIDDAIVQQIVAHPEYLFPRIESATSTVGVILDIGGHHGFYAAEALRRYPNREVIVVEPHPGWCRLIQKQAKANGGTNRTTVVNGCLAADNAGRVLRFNPDSSWGATVHADGGGRISIRVNSFTLQEILTGKVPDLIYCNAEGAEYALIPQLRSLNLLPQTMVLCIHPEFGNATQLREQIREMGFTEQNVNNYEPRPIFHYTRP